MKVIKNQNKEEYEEISNMVKNNDGYCPCRLIKTEDTKCMCKEFRDQISNPEFEGFCHCGLYYKEK